MGLRSRFSIRIVLEIHKDPTIPISQQKSLVLIVNREKSRAYCNVVGLSCPCA
jgi:hypothetical protein